MSFDPQRIKDCPGPIAACAVAAMACAALGIDLVLLAGAGSPEAVVARALAKAVSKVFLIAILAGLVYGVDTLWQAWNNAIDCLKSHGHDTSAQEAVRDKVKALLDWLKKKLDDEKKI